MFIPFRKCFHVLKLTLILMIVVSLLALFEKWRGGKRTASAYRPGSEEDEYERQIRADEAKIIVGLGEDGKPAYLTGDEKQLGEESEKNLAMNVYLSDRIAYNRTLADARNTACKRVLYDAELPSVSVILIFHNEPYSVVLRTIWSVINSVRRDLPFYRNARFVDSTGKKMNLGYPGQDPSSPYLYLRELILVDDNSTLPELKGKLSHYIRTRLPPNLIKILRLPSRFGLTRARISGAQYASSDVLVFLDAHCETQADWLRPMLQRIKERRTAVVTPIIDVIDASTLYYSVQEPPDNFQIGGFTFTGHFTWIDVPAREKKRRESDIAPTWSPTMAGGLFAIDRAYFWELGAYDEQMSGWGGENLEMSFRIWQCGGTLETVPCARVGHVFRAFHPYALHASSDTHGLNTARMAHVWMDKYRELFFVHRPDLRNNPKIGDVTHRKILREKLQCKSFQWYLDNIYREKYVPVRDSVAFGRFRNPSSNLCIDSLQREGSSPALGLYPCHAALQATQYYSLSRTGQLRDEERCADVPYSREKRGEEGITVHMVNCYPNSRTQIWRFVDNKRLQHVQSGLCLSSAGSSTGGEAAVRSCDEDHDALLWVPDAVVQDGTIDFRVKTLPLDQMENLKSLLDVNGRHARSLLARSRHHRGKHKRKPDKFIIRIERTLSNGSEQHLEMDIHCKHRRLQANDTFVRDLVTILNKHDIRVINNGRLFEKHHVVELPRHAARDSPQPPSPPEQYPTKPPVSQWMPDPAVESSPPAKPPTVDRYPPPSEPGKVRPREKISPVDEDSSKILVEDFVSISTTPKHGNHKKERRREHKLRKEKRKRPRDRSIETHDPPSISSTRHQSSGEQSSSAEKPSSDHHFDNWIPNDSSTYRRRDSERRRHHADIKDDDVSEEIDEHQSAAVSAEKPVRVTVRSNLTFRLGDELFSWATSEQPSVSRLSRPAQRSPPGARGTGGGAGGEGGAGGGASGGGRGAELGAVSAADSRDESADEDHEISLENTAH